jgi:hypothetical protein
MDRAAPANSFPDFMNHVLRQSGCQVFRQMSKKMGLQRGSERFWQELCEGIPALRAVTQLLAMRPAIPDRNDLAQQAFALSANQRSDFNLGHRCGLFLFLAAAKVIVI